MLTIKCPQKKAFRLIPHIYECIKDLECAFAPCASQKKIYFLASWVYNRETYYSGVPNKHAARLLILGNFSVQHALIRSNTFIIFWKNFLPTRLFRATRLLKFWNEKHLWQLSSVKNLSLLLSEFYNERLSEIKSWLPISDVLCANNLKAMKLGCDICKNDLVATHLSGTTRLLALLKFSAQHVYLDYTFIRIFKIFRPTRLLGLHVY